MPNIKSAIKRVRVADKKNLENRMVKSALKTQLKKFSVVSAEGDSVAKEQALRVTSASVDKAAAKGVIHKNAANRKKAQLSKIVRG